jgi:hypothetical protein
LDGLGNAEHAAGHLDTAHLAWLDAAAIFDELGPSRSRAHPSQTRPARARTARRQLDHVGALTPVRCPAPSGAAPEHGPPHHSEPPRCPVLSGNPHAVAGDLPA